MTVKSIVQCDNCTNWFTGTRQMAIFWGWLSNGERDLCPHCRTKKTLPTSTLLESVVQDIISKINNEMNEVRQESARKQAQSERDAAGVILK